MKISSKLAAGAVIASLAASLALGTPAGPAPRGPRAKNVIFFVGDGMSVSTVTATRIYSVGVAGKLAIDTLPYTALSKTYTADYITPDSAGTMTAMITGQITNSGMLGLDKTTEPRDFNRDGDGKRLTTVLEIAKSMGKRVGVVSTARITHATPAACYAKTNDRGRENQIALQALPGDEAYNTALAGGIDLMVGGGRRHFVPRTTVDEEGERGRRSDGRDLRKEFQKAGYRYVWNTTGWNAVDVGRALPLLALFESSHMEYEHDRKNDAGGEPSLTDIVKKSIEMLAHDNDAGYFLMVEGGRIDHAHHASNAWRAIVDTEELDQAIAAAVEKVDLDETLIVVTSDHSHVFNIAGYPVRQPSEMPYEVKSAANNWKAPFNGIFHTVFGLNPSTGAVVEVGDKNGVPYTALGYLNGGGYRGVPRVSPWTDRFKGYGGTTVEGPNDPDYLQEALVPLSSETHSAEDVVIYAVGAGAEKVHGTVKNTFCFEVMVEAMGGRKPSTK